MESHLPWGPRFMDWQTRASSVGDQHPFAGLFARAATIGPAKRHFGSPVECLVISTLLADDGFHSGQQEANSEIRVSSEHC